MFCSTNSQVHYLKQRARVSFRHFVELIANSAYVHGDIFIWFMLIILHWNVNKRCSMCWSYKALVMKWQYNNRKGCKNISVYIFSADDDIFQSVCVPSMVQKYSSGSICLMFILFISLAGGYKTVSLITKSVFFQTKAAAFQLPALSTRAANDLKSCSDASFFFH